MTRCLFCAVLIVCTAAFSCVAAAQDNHGTQMILSMKVCEKATECSEPKILAEPILVAIAGRPFSLESGGSLTANSEGNDFRTGTRVSGKFELSETGTVQLALKVRIASAVPQDEPETALVRMEILEIRTTLQPGKTKRINCSASQWCELTAKPVE